MLCLDEAARALSRALTISAALGLASCGGNVVVSDAPDPAGANAPAKLLASFLGLKSSEAKSDAAVATGGKSRHIFCPQVFVLEGTAASRTYAGTPPSSANLRYQVAINDTARECSLQGNELAIKIGVAGKVLLGPAGTAGDFSVPVRMAILRKRNNVPIVSKLYRATAAVPPGQTQTDFTIISEPLLVPFIQDHAEEDYTIRVGIDEGAGQGEKAQVEGRGKRKR